MSFSPSAEKPSERWLLSRNQEDLGKATRLARHGESVILVKLTPYDVELPAVDMLVTCDPALNEASHMALLAKSAGIGHLNISHTNSPLMSFLLTHEGKEVSLESSKEGEQVIKATPLVEYLCRDRA